jgi:hypothetical protein
MLRNCALLEGEWPPSFYPPPLQEVTLTDSKL